MDTEEKEWVFVYWYFNHGGGNVWQDKRNPIIPAIASLRYFLPKVEIQVVDVSNAKCNWADFPKKFNFSVTFQKFFLSDNKQLNKYTKPPSLELLSKQEDCNSVIRKSNKKYVLVSDVDIFWVKSPLPLSGSGKQGFWVSGESSVNSGLYYYRRSDSEVFLNLWRGLNLLAAYDEQFCHDILITQNCQHMLIIIEERILEYALKKIGSDEVRFYSENENFCFFNGSNSENAKALHFFNGWCKEGDTLSIIPKITELNDIMKCMFTASRYQKIFGKDENINVSYKNNQEVRSLFNL